MPYQSAINALSQRHKALIAKKERGNDKKIFLKIVTCLTANNLQNFKSSAYFRQQPVKIAEAAFLRGVL